ncbi:MAG: hypothetical protein MUO72_13245 [Bacteroidales bacterium]|nr:hypothetical protein [Bacteroidales bacterium]
MLSVSMLIKEIENLIKGNKSMIICGADSIKPPHGRVNEGDVLYFIYNKGDGVIKAKGVVSLVFNSDQLSVEESFKTIIMHQDKLQLPDQQFDKWAGKKYLVLIGLADIEEVEPFCIKESNFVKTDDWLTVGIIEKVTVTQTPGEVLLFFCLVCQDHWTIQGS